MEKAEAWRPFSLGFSSQIFTDIDKWTYRMFKTFEDLESQSKKGKLPPNTLYYGYSLTIGPDGKPQVREFGNVRPTRTGQLEVGSREPFVETMIDEKQNQLKVMAEMPGIRKEDISTEVTEKSLTIRAEHGERKYDTTVSLDIEVDPNSAKAIYNNGVLEIALKLKSPPSEQQKHKGISVRIE